MTKSNRVRLLELLLAVALGLGTAFYRAGLAEKSGKVLNYGGLGIPMGALYGIYAAGVLLLAACAVFLFSRQDITGHKTGPGHKAAAIAAAVGMMAAGGLLFYENMGNLRLIIYVQAAFLVICGAMLVTRAIAGDNSAVAGMSSLFPVYYLCMLLFVFYRENAKNPVNASFSTEIIAIISMLLAAYALSSLYFEKPKPRMQLALCLAAVFFSSMETASFLLYRPLLASVPGVSFSMVVTFAAMGIYAAGGVFTPPRPLPEPEEQAEEEDESAAEADAGIDDLLTINDSDED